MISRDPGRLILQPLRRAPVLVRDAAAFACMLAVYAASAGLPSVEVPLAVPLLAGTVLLLSIGLGRASALFAALLLILVARLFWSSDPELGLELLELGAFVVLGLAATTVCEKLRRYRREMEEAHARMEMSVSAAADRVERLRHALRAAEQQLAEARRTARRQPVQQDSRPAPAAQCEGDPFASAFRSEGGA